MGAIVAEPKDQRRAWDRPLLRLIWNNVGKNQEIIQHF